MTPSSRHVQAKILKEEIYVFLMEHRGNMSLLTRTPSLRRFGEHFKRGSCLHIGGALAVTSCKGR